MKAKNRVDKEKQAKRLIRAIITSLRKPSDTLPTFVFKKHLKGVTGFYDVETITLAIFTEPIQTLLHELVHYQHPTWTETKVLQAERMMKHYITMKEVIIILKLFVKHL
jgi:hypothetical protein